MVVATFYLCVSILCTSSIGNWTSTAVFLLRPASVSQFNQELQDAVHDVYRNQDDVVIFEAIPAKWTQPVMRGALARIPAQQTPLVPLVLFPEHRSILHETASSACDARSNIFYARQILVAGPPVPQSLLQAAIGAVRSHQPATPDDAATAGDKFSVEGLTGAIQWPPDAQRLPVAFLSITSKSKNVYEFTIGLGADASFTYEFRVIASINNEMPAVSHVTYSGIVTRTVLPGAH